MKILIFASNIGKTAPGIVFEKLINGLSQMHQIDVVTESMDSKFELEKVNEIIEIKKNYLHPRIFKLFISWLNISPVDWYWSKRAIKNLVKKNKSNYDLIFCFISFHHYASLLAGIRYSEKIGRKLAVYSVDAIPAPLGWSKDNGYYKSVKRMMELLLSKADFFFSANQQMLDYQLTVFKPKASIITGVIYNPNDGKLKNIEHDKNVSNTFLYTGGIYGVRKPIYILQAFSRLLNDYPNCILEFVGSHIPEKYLTEFNGYKEGKVIIHPHVRDLHPFYQRAKALIDIDGDIPNDVFLSSKIVNYLEVNRIIISETGPDSPSRNIFRDIPSILQCDHNSESLYKAMRAVVEGKASIDFADRKYVLELFSICNVVKGINEKLNAGFK